jgi:hypothetical protein
MGRSVVSKEALSRIEKAIETLCEAQGQLTEEVRSLASRVEAVASGSANGGVTQEKLLEFLDQFRAGEALGEAGLGAWIATCKTECLKGGLRTIQHREGFHSRLLEERLKELGGSPKFEIPEAIVSGYMESVGSEERTDEDKLRDFVKQVGTDIDKALKPIHDIADGLDRDPETQSLLRTIAQDERSTLEFIGQACELLGVS